jgi:hypothetical protein
MHSGVIDTAMTCTAVSMTPLCKYDTAVTFDVLFARLWLPLKGISIEKTYIGQLSYTIPITFTHKKWGLTRDRFCHSGVIDTAVTKIGEYKVDLLREY